MSRSTERQNKYKLADINLSDTNYDTAVLGCSGFDLKFQPVYYGAIKRFSKHEQAFQDNLYVDQVAKQLLTQTKDAGKSYDTLIHLGDLQYPTMARDTIWRFIIPYFPQALQRLSKDKRNSIDTQLEKLGAKPLDAYLPGGNGDIIATNFVAVPGNHESGSEDKGVPAETRDQNSSLYCDITAQASNSAHNEGAGTGAGAGAGAGATAAHEQQNALKQRFKYRLVKNSEGNTVCFELFLDSNSMGSEDQRDREQEQFLTDIKTILNSSTPEGWDDAECKHIRQAKNKVIYAHHAPFTTGSRYKKNEKHKYRQAQKGNHHQAVYATLLRCLGPLNRFTAYFAAHEHREALFIPSIAGETKYTETLPQCIVISGNGGAVANKKDIHNTGPGQVHSCFGYGAHSVQYNLEGMVLSYTGAISESTSGQKHDLDFTHQYTLKIQTNTAGKPQFEYTRAPEPGREAIFRVGSQHDSKLTPADDGHDESKGADTDEAAEAKNEPEPTWLSLLYGLPQEIYRHKNLYTIITTVFDGLVLLPSVEMFIVTALCHTESGADKKRLQSLLAIDMPNNSKTKFSNLARFISAVDAILKQDQTPGKKLPEDFATLAILRQFAAAILAVKQCHPSCEFSSAIQAVRQVVNQALTIIARKSITKKLIDAGTISHEEETEIGDDNAPQHGLGEGITARQRTSTIDSPTTRRAGRAPETTLLVLSEVLVSINNAKRRGDVALRLFNGSELDTGRLLVSFFADHISKTHLAVDRFLGSIVNTQSATQDAFDPALVGAIRGCSINWTEAGATDSNIQPMVAASNSRTDITALFSRQSLERLCKHHGILTWLLRHRHQPFNVIEMAYHACIQASQHYRSNPFMTTRLLASLSLICSSGASAMPDADTIAEQLNDYLRQVAAGGSPEDINKLRRCASFNSITSETHELKRIFTTLVSLLPQSSEAGTTENKELTALVNTLPEPAHRIVNGSHTDPAREPLLRSATGFKG